MAQSTRDNAKRKKRPDQTGTLVGVRLQPDLLKQLDAFREQHPGLSRPEAIRSVLTATFGIIDKADPE